MPGHAELTKRVHAHGAAIFAQIYHAGRQATRGITGMDTVAPTAICCPFTGEMPHALTLDEIERSSAVRRRALRAKQAGFDGVEVHGGHGYLIAQFMSSYSNKRFDKYGGSLYNRIRLPLEIVAEIREKCGADFLIQFRISATSMCRRQDHRGHQGSPGCWSKPAWTASTCPWAPTAATTQVAARRRDTAG